jgi:putative DNA primase/helicase
MPLTAAGLCDLAARAARFQNYDGRKNDWKFVPPPVKLMEILMGRKKYAVPTLKGVINHPFLRADGSLVCTPGFDEKTGVYFDAQGVEFPPLPEITPDNAYDLAQSAMARVMRLFHTFDFVDEASRSVILAFALTGIMRRSMRAAPLFLMDASVADAGKGLIVRILAWLLMGDAPPIINYGDDTKEFEKRLSAMLMAGFSLISIDNCTTPIDGDQLCSVSAEELVQRVLQDDAGERRKPHHRQWEQPDRYWRRYPPQPQSAPGADRP